MKKNNIPEPVEALILVLLTFSGLILFSLTVISFLIEGDEIPQNSTELSMVFMFGKLLFISVPLYYSFKKKYHIKKLFKINPVSRDVIIFSIIIGLSLVAITDEIQRVVDMIVPMPESMKELLKASKDIHGFEWGLLFFASVFIVPITDEGLFRGFLQVSLENKGDPVRAVILTSVCWALIHISPYLAIPIFILGIFLGYLAWKTKSLIPSIIIQSVYGLVAVSLLDSALEESVYSWYLTGDHVSPLVLVAAAAGLYYSIKMIDQQEV